jgi:circadian clock protein KaiB
VRGGRGVADRSLITLTLYVAGQTQQSQVMETRLRALCEARLAGRYELLVVDVVDHPELAELHEIVVFPTVVRTAPFPQLRVIGDLSDDARTAAGLGFPDPFTTRRQNRDDQ